MTILTSLSLENAHAEESIKQALQRPLIVGASVSADWKSKSPGKLLALKYTNEVDIKTIAIGGRSGRDVLKNVKENDLKDRTIVIGLDLFFWDATLKTPGESLSAMQNLLQSVRAMDIPIILGEVPLLLPGIQPGAASINAALHKACRDYDKCTVVPFTSMLFKVLANGGLQYKGKRYSYRELVPDGLHIGPVASQYIADEIYTELLAKAED